MNGTIAAVALLFACSQAGITPEQEKQKPASAQQGDTVNPGVVEGVVDSRPFVVRSAISGRVELGNTMLGKLMKGEQNGFAVVLLSEDPNECALREKNTARKGARYLVMRLADRVERSRLTTPPRGGGGREIGKPSAMDRAEVRFTTRDDNCGERTVIEAQHGSVQLLGLVKSKSPLYRGEFELTFGKGTGDKVKGEFRAPICEAFSQQLKLGAKAPAPTCVAPAEEGKASVQ